MFDYTSMHNTQNIKINAVTGAILKNHPKSWFERFHLNSERAKSLLCEGGHSATKRTYNDDVDHRNRKRNDNRKYNLRCCCYAENNRNRGLCITNTSGYTGVSFDKRRNKWTASITFNSKKLFIGRFERKEDAIADRLQKEAELFKDFAPQIALINTLDWSTYNGNLYHQSA